MKKYYRLDKEELTSLIDTLRREKGLTNKKISDFIGADIGSYLYQNKSIPEDAYEKLLSLAKSVNRKITIRGEKEVSDYSIEDMQQLARDVGLEKTGVEGKCLSDEYEDMKKDLIWWCGNCTFIFEKTPDKVKFRREWCSRCSQNPHFLHKQITIYDMQKLAHDVGIEKTGISGRFLSKEYINSSTKSKWYCGNCHNKFLMTPNDVKSKRTWCPRCAGREQTIEDMRKLARVVGLERTGFPGLFLSNEYKGATSKHLWGCGACGYNFFMTSNKVKSRRSWCPKCAHKVAPTLKELQKLAYNVGIEKTGLPGKFLSNKYKGSEKIYQWRCGKCKSIFEKSIDKVRHRRSWCPYCSQGYYERILRGFMERIFSYLYKKKIIFSKTPLNQVIMSIAGEEGVIKYNPAITGFDITRMHLDGYSFDILVGFERQGKQHYVRVPEWQQIDGQFERQLEIDKFKNNLCKQNSILLIVIGYECQNGILKRIEPEEIQEKIIQQIEEKTGKKLPPIPKFDYRKFFKEDMEDEINFRKNLGERQEFRYLTDYQRRILLEFTNTSLFTSDLLNMTHLKDINSLDWMIRDLYQKGYLKRQIAFNPSAFKGRKKQYKYYLSELGKRLLDLSLS